MGEARTSYKAKLPRPDSGKPSFDDSTGDALKDGYTRLGPRRPIGAMAGDIMDADEAKRFEEMDRLYPSTGLGWADW